MKTSTSLYFNNQCNFKNIISALLIKYKQNMAVEIESAELVIITIL